jgi:hypothetical protein
MPDVSGIAALDVLIGLFFLYFVLSTVCSAVNEAISQTLNLRAKNLERGIRNLLNDSEHVTAFYKHWRVQALSKPPRPLIGRRPPSYIPLRVFALTVLDTFAPPTDAVESSDLVARAKRTVETIQNPFVRGLIEDALNESRADVDRFRTALEKSFDEVMDRASGWYKRRVQIILFLIALALVGISNADSFSIGQRLWKDDALRAVVVARAQNQSNATSCRDPEATSPADRAAQCVDQIEELGIPFGWSAKTSPNNLEEDLGKALGLLITAFALSFGAPFWFDLLGKVANLRGTGPREPTTETPAVAPPQTPTSKD